jgi:DNA-binding MarR family transcriptional regulator
MDELEALRVRDEVLQALYWMRSEGLADAASAEELARFLAVPRDTLTVFLGRFVDDGYLESLDSTRAAESAPTRYRLTASGEEAGKRSFADEFADLTRPTHGECDDDCWCHESPEEAARCLEERRSVHAH